MQDWSTIAENMKEQFENENLSQQAFTNSNFMLAVTPPEDEFFGTKVRNVFVVQKPYGWKRHTDGKMIFPWPPDGVIDSLNRYNALAEKFAELQTVFYIDVASAKDYTKNIDPESDLEQMMRCTGREIQKMCQGQEHLTFGGFIEEYVPEDYLFEDAQQFFGEPAYKIHTTE